MRFRDLREYIAFLEQRGELRRISTSVDPYLEITEVADRVIKSGGPALLFENPQGYDIPVVINLYGSAQRTAWALGVDDLDEVAERVQETLNLVQGPPEGLAGKLRTLGQLVSLASYRPRTVSQPSLPRRGTSGRGCRPVQVPYPAMLAHGWRPLHHPAAGDYS